MEVIVDDREVVSFDAATPPGGAPLLALDTGIPVVDLFGVQLTCWPQ